jgi:lincosamide nucleotidyltransferase A/C/D/E
MKFDKQIMTAADALALYDLFRSHGITVWVDGGWGVDALLGRQTRPHSDLDIALRHSDVPKLRALLEERG